MKAMGIDHFILSLKELEARARDDKTNCKVDFATPHVVDVQAIRKRLKLTQKVFAEQYDFPECVAKNHESGRK